jgi:hypothetical protein
MLIQSLKLSPGAALDGKSAALATIGQQGAVPLERLN